HHVVTDGALDPLVTGLLTATVDARAYPMFAALYGYGLGADRRDAAGARLVGGGRARLPAAPRARPGAARRAARRPGVLRRHPRLVRAARGAARGCVGALVRPTAARRGGGDPARGRGRGRGRAGHRLRRPAGAHRARAVLVDGDRGAAGGAAVARRRVAD